MSNLYRRRPATAEAIQWTDTNAAELEAFAGHRFMTIDPEDRIDDAEATASLIESAHECWSLMHPGDWVVKRGDDFAVLTPEEFADLYEPAGQAPATDRAAEPLCMCGHPMRHHHEDVCLTECGCNDGREPEAATDLPGRLADALTARFTQQGNLHAGMRRHEQGPDGWPASHPVGPRDVAEVLRELLAAAVLPATADRATPCSQPNPCEDGELCAAHEEQQAHADGEHQYCGITCEVQMPAAPMRNSIVAHGIPGTAGMLDELLRRAAAGLLPTVEEPGPDVVAFRNPDQPTALWCRKHGARWWGLTPLTSQDLPDGGLCGECGVDVLIPQETDRG